MNGDDYHLKDANANAPILFSSQNRLKTGRKESRTNDNIVRKWDPHEMKMMMS